MDIEALVKFMAGELVENKEAVSVKTDGSIVFLTVDKNDMGKIIGRQGRTAKALKTIVKAAGAKSETKYTLEITDQTD